jgi:hypothetical protein
VIVGVCFWFCGFNLKQKTKQNKTKQNKTKQNKTKQTKQKNRS